LRDNPRMAIPAQLEEQLAKLQQAFDWGAYLKLVVEASGHEQLYNELAAIMRERDMLLAAVERTRHVDDIEEHLAKWEAAHGNDVRDLERQAAAELTRQEEEAKRDLARNQRFVAEFQLSPEINELYAKFIRAVNDEKGAASDKILANVKRDLARFRRSKRRRVLLRQGLRAFWLLGVFGILATALSSLIPILWVSIAIVPIFLWILQDLVFAPWFEKKQLERRRSDAIRLLRELYFVKMLTHVDKVLLDARSAPATPEKSVPRGA
jgi:hypothetical protein